jgi:hypothetical protein
MTASGEVYDPAGLSVAHLTFPFGGLVEIRNLDNGRRILARVNDRGPYVQDRIIDCSLGAALALGFVGHGVARVSVKLLDSSADLSLIAARRPPALVEDAAPQVPNAHAFADRLALDAWGRAVIVAHAATRASEHRGSELRRASVLPFPVLIHATRWIVNAILGPRGERHREPAPPAGGCDRTAAVLRFCIKQRGPPRRCSPAPPSHRTMVTRPSRHHPPVSLPTAAPRHTPAPTAAPKQTSSQTTACAQPATPPDTSTESAPAPRARRGLDPADAGRSSAGAPTPSRAAALTRNVAHARPPRAATSGSVTSVVTRGRSRQYAAND